MVKYFAFFFAVICIFFGFQYQSLVNGNGPLQEETFVVIPRGAGLKQLAQILKDKGVIRSDFLFCLAAKIKGDDKRLRAGEYRFKPQSSIMNILKKITDGDVYYRKITLPEGLTTVQMLEIILAEPSLRGDITLQPQEGDLLPETYSFVFGDSRDSIITQAETAMKKLKQELWNERDGAVPLKSMEEMLVLASIIEKETGVPDERKLVASVFVNRLRKGMRLQTDPTVIYALTHGKFELERPLTRKDLDVDSPYNTYREVGLPPAPICNPGRASLEAAVHPEETRYLYFVANGEGGHNFAETLKMHNRNVSDYRKRK